jgi:hypothetical protein
MHVRQSNTSILGVFIYPETLLSERIGGSIRGSRYQCDVQKGPRGKAVNQAVIHDAILRRWIERHPDKAGGSWNPETMEGAFAKRVVGGRFAVSSQAPAAAGIAMRCDANVDAIISLSSDADHPWRDSRPPRIGRTTEHTSQQPPTPHPSTGPARQPAPGWRSVSQADASASRFRAARAPDGFRPLICDRADGSCWGGPRLVAAVFALLWPTTAKRQQRDPPSASIHRPWEGKAREEQRASQASAPAPAPPAAAPPPSSSLDPIADRQPSLRLAAIFGTPVTDRLMPYH